MMQAIELLKTYINTCYTKQLLEMRYDLILPPELEAIVKIYNLRKKYQELVYQELKFRPKVYNKKESRIIRQIMSEKKISRQKAESIFQNQ